MRTQEAEIGKTAYLLKVPNRYKVWATKRQPVTIVGLLKNNHHNFQRPKPYIEIKISDANHAYSVISVPPSWITYNPINIY